MLTPTRARAKVDPALPEDFDRNIHNVSMSPEPSTSLLLTAITKHFPGEAVTALVDCDPLGRLD